MQLTAYSLAGFVAVLLFWAGMYKDTYVLDTINRTELACEWYSLDRKSWS